MDLEAGQRVKAVHVVAATLARIKARRKPPGIARDDVSAISQ
jgi:hypothetical protein